jgi:type VI secretion system secreted protein Hcp
MLMYLKISNGDRQIKGDVTNPSYFQWIELSSVQLGISRPTTTGTSRYDVEKSGSFQDIVVTKEQDSSSAELYQAALTGTAGPAIIAFLETTDEGWWREFMRVELGETMVSGFTMSSGGDKPTESVSLNFTSKKITYQ